MTVYVVQDCQRYDRDTGQYVPSHDLSPAAEFGDLKYLLTPTAAPWHTESIIQDLWDGLADFTPSDYLLLVGNPVFIGLAATVACDITGGRIRFLQWNGKERRYLPIEAQVYEVARPSGRG